MVLRLYEVVFLQHLVYLCLFCNGGSGHLNILTVAISNALSIGAEAAVPVFSVALDDSANKYPILYQNYTSSYVSIAPPGPDPCSPAGAGEVTKRISQLYGSDDFFRTVNIILTPVCTLPFPLIGDFAREGNILTISCGPAEVTDFKRYPTTMMTYSGGAVAVGLSLTIFSDMYQWRRLSILFDTVNVRVENSLQGIMLALKKRAVDFDILTTTFNSDADGESPEYPAALRKAGQHSRIIIIMTLDRFIRKIMSSAVDLGMTMGNYVFIYPYSLQIPAEPPIIWNFQHETKDEKILKAMSSILVLRYASVDWESWTSKSEKIQRLRNEMFNLSFNPDMQHNEILLGCYESVEILSQLLNESLNESTNLNWQPQNFVRQVINRTFSLSHRNISFAADGKRIPQIVLQQYNTALKDFEDIMKFNSVTETWLFISSNRFIWKDGKIPQDHYICGLQNEWCHISLDTLKTVLIAVVVFGVFITTVTGIWHRPWIQKDSSWWRLEKSLFVPDENGP